MSERCALVNARELPLTPEQLLASVKADWQPGQWGGEWTPLVKPGLGGRARWRWRLSRSGAEHAGRVPKSAEPPQSPQSTGAAPGEARVVAAPTHETVLYVKCYRRTGLRSQWDRIWRQSPWRSRAWWEYHCADELARKYVPVVQALAVAERMCGCWEVASTAVFQRVPGAPLDVLLAEAVRTGRPAVHGPARHELARRLGRFVSAFHQTGLCHRDLYLCHIFAELDLDARQPPRFTLIDLARVLRPRWRRMRWIVKDLAQLDSSACPLGATRTDRLRFLLAYLGLQPGSPRTRVYARRITQKSAAILRREARRQPPR